MAILRIGNIGERMDLDIKQGATFRQMFEMYGPIDEDNETHVAQGYGDPVDLTGCTIRGKIRKTRLSATVTCSFTCTITDPTLGKYEIFLSDTTTAAITAGEKITDKASKYTWDLELLDTLSYVTPLYHGDVYVKAEVTR